MKLPNFLGRERELTLLNQLLKKKAASLVVVSGRRRIGKSRLIAEFGSQHTFYSFIGLPPSKTENPTVQRTYFAKRMSQQFSMPMPASDDWTDLFWFLADRVKEGRIVILLDELSWMAQGDETFLGKLKTAWDEHFKNNSQLIMVLCSSVSIWMERNILADKGFMGRRSLSLHLQELALQHCDKFWGAKHATISAFEKLKFLSVTGGVPRYLEELKPNLSSEENIKLLCFDQSGVLFNEFDEIFADIFVSDTMRYKEIVMTLASGPKEQKEIAAALHTKQNKVLSDYLNELEQAGFITRDYGWHIKTNKEAKHSRYRLSDNYLRFYLKYILPKRRLISSGDFVDQSLESIVNWSSIIGIQFENLVLNNRKKIRQLMGIKPGEWVIDGPYFQHKTSKQDACQIDYMVQTKYKTLYICEIKFRKNKIGSDVIDQVKEKIKRLKMPKGFSYRAVLIHVNGVQDSVIDQDFFSSIIAFDELLST